MFFNVETQLNQNAAPVAQILCKNIKYCHSEQLQSVTQSALHKDVCVCVCSVVTIKDREEQQKSSGRDIGGTKLTLHDRSHPQVLVSAPLTGFKSVLWRENKANL